MITTQTIRAIWHTISRLPTAASLVALLTISGLCGLVWGRLTGAVAQARWVAVATLLFGLADATLLSLLPRMELSYGPVGLPLLGITLVRAGLLLALGWLIGVLMGRWPQVPGLLLALILQLGITGCSFYGLYIEPFALGVTHLTVETAKPLPMERLRIVQLSDLHIERTTRRERDVVAQVQALKPDLIVLTGDYLSTSYLNEIYALHDLSWLLADLDAPLGIYAILAKPGDSAALVNTVFGSVEMTVLDDAVSQIRGPQGEMSLVGVTFNDPSRVGDADTLRTLMAQMLESRFTLVLYHPPDLAPQAAELGADLYLCGHTHGGQIRLPWYGAVFTASRLGKRYEMGRYQVEDMTLYVSRGLGMEGQGAPRARFLCPPEIVVVDLVSVRE